MLPDPNEDRERLLLFIAFALAAYAVVVTTLWQYAFRGFQ